MEPNTEYLTGTKLKNKQSRRKSESNEGMSFMNQINDSLFEKLMSCPLKRNLVLNLIASEHDNIEEYKRNRIERQKSKEKNTPESLSKIRKKNHYESPVALLRRKALEQQTTGSPTNFPQNENRPNSRQSEASSSLSASPLLCEKILNGVVAFVEVKSHGQDRSQGVKILMRNLGADVTDTFTKDVTHVVFKDGSFTTYQKARLLNVHLVSVLWIEACKNSNIRIDESKYPAFGTDIFNHNVSAFCSQLQKDYEDIIRDELKRSLAAGTPLPSTQTIINRRRTLMTPGISRNLSQEFSSTQDREVAEITRHQITNNIFGANSTMNPRLSPIITSDEDSDLDAMIDGNFVSKKRKYTCPKSFVEETPSPSVNMELTNINFSRRNTVNEVTPVSDIINSSVQDITSPNISKSIYDLKTPKLMPNTTALLNDNKDNSSVSSNGSLYRRRTGTIDQIHISDPSLRKENNLSAIEGKSPSSCIPELKLCDTPSISIISKNSARASLLVSSSKKTKLDSELKLPLEKDKIKNQSDIKEPCKKSVCQSVSAPTNEKSSSLSTLQLSSEKPNGEKSTSMSSLRISSESHRNIQNKQNENCDVQKSVPTKLRQTGSYNSNKSFSPLDSKVIGSILDILDTPLPPDSNVTRRKRVKRPIAVSKKQLFENKNDTTNEENDSVLVEKKYVKNESVSEKQSVKRRTRSTALDSDNDELKCATKTCNEKLTYDKKKQKISIFNSEKECDDNNKKQVKVNDTSQRQIVNSSTEDSENGSLEKTKKKRNRKLYDPDELFTRESVVGDQMEREKRRRNRDKSKNKQGVIVVPDIVQTKSALILSDSTKEFLNKHNIDIKDILNPSTEESDTEKKQSSPNKKRKKNNGVENIFNGDRDEQKELTEEILRKQKLVNTSTQKKNLDETSTENAILKKPESRRLSVRLSRKASTKGSSSGSSSSITPVKIVQKNTPAKSMGIISRKTSQKQKFNTTSQPKFKCTPTSKNRRSTMEFQSQSDMNTTKKLKINKLKSSSIVCTKMHKDNVIVFNQIVKKLGRFVVEDEVSSKTTHLVAGESKRTINMLRAVARGCWILKHEWLLRSLESEKWLSEEDFEVNDFSPAVQQCRLQRQAFDSSYSMDVFKDYGYIYVAKGSIPRCSDLRELITLCKGKITTRLRHATIVVGGFLKQDGVTCVKETWVMDCIQFNKKFSFKKYVIKEDNKVVL